MILLDTSICIDVINAKPAAVLQRFRQYRIGEIGVCSVVAAELADGVAKSGSIRNRQALEMFLAPLSILPFRLWWPLRERITGVMASRCPAFCMLMPM